MTMNLSWGSCTEALLERFHSGNVILLPVKTLEEVNSSPEEPAIIQSPILRYKSEEVERCVEMSQGPEDLEAQFDFTRTDPTTDNVFEDTKR